MAAYDVRKKMSQLDPLIGTWDTCADFSDARPSERGGRTTFESSLDGTYVLERTQLVWPHAPSSMAIIAGTLPVGDVFTQHYFDSRGVVRLYQMTFRAGAWTLMRDRADFSPLEFWQRFTAGFIGANTIEGVWEKSTDRGATWIRDVGITYRRAG